MLKVVGASWAQTRRSTFLLGTIAALGIFAICFMEIPMDTRDGNYAATVFWGHSTGFRIEFRGQGNDPGAIRQGVARAYYRPDMSSTGWAVLEIETQSEYPDWVQAHAAGLLEGSLSWQLIYWHWQNTVEHACDGREEFCSKTREFLKHNSKTVKAMALMGDKTDPFWHQVHLFYNQLEGLAIGWRYGVKRSRQDRDIPDVDFLWMNVACDLRDLELRFNGSRELDPTRPSLSMALLKVVPKYPNSFLLAHATAGFYSEMLRVQKRFHFGFHMTGDHKSGLVPGRILVFTSYPAALHSQDDFYHVIGDQRLIVTGTSIKNYNVSLWDAMDTEVQVLMGPRVLAANRLASDGKEWATYVSISNSGTGNKQWLVVTLANQSFSLWVVEQIPGVVRAAEQGDTLKRKGYWASYGKPYFQDIVVASGYDVLSNNTLLGANHKKSQVAFVLERGQMNVTDRRSLINLMRGPDLSLVGRGDLFDKGIEYFIEVNSRNASADKQEDGPFNITSSLDNNTYLEFDGLTQRRVRLPRVSSGVLAQLDEYLENNATSGENSVLDDREVVISNSIEYIDDTSDNAAVYESSSSPINGFRDLFNYIVKTSNISISGLDVKLKGDERQVKNSDDTIQKKSVQSEAFTSVIDLKITTGDGFQAAAGPPYSDADGSIIIKPFQWSKSAIKDVPHVGQSDIWKFDPVEPIWVWA